MARTFSGTTDKINFGDVTVLDGAASCWFSFIIDPLIDTTRRGISGRWSSANSQNQFILEMLSSGDLRLFVANALTDAGGNLITTTGNPLSAGFKHCLIVYDGGQGTNADRVKFYVDNVEATAKSASGTIPATMTTPSAANNFWIGDINLNAIKSVNSPLAEFAIGTGVPSAGMRAALSARANPITMPLFPKFYAPLWGNDSPEPEFIIGAAGALSGTSKEDHPRMAGYSPPLGIQIAGAGAAAANPKGPLGMPLHGPLAGPI